MFYRLATIDDFNLEANNFSFMPLEVIEELRKKKEVTGKAVNILKSTIKLPLPDCVVACEKYIAYSLALEDFINNGATFYVEASYQRHVDMIRFKNSVMTKEEIEEEQNELKNYGLYKETRVGLE